MRSEDEQVFQNAQKEVDLQIIDFVQFSSTAQDKYPSKKESPEKVGWKFRVLGSNSPAKKSPNKFTRNISFEDERHDEQSDDDDSDEVECRESQFCSYYRGSQEVYKKKIGFGTNWIGSRQYFTSVFINPTRVQKQNLRYYTNQSPFTQDAVRGNCQFDSEFESGNLFCSFKVGPNEYDLLLQNDINTKGNTQWFYFRISNPPRGNAITINIVNLRKNDSLFNYGLMPCLYSLEQNKKSKAGWFRGGRDIKYFRNDHQIQNSKRYYYTLTFTVSTNYERDTLLIAHSYPYTVSDLNNYLDGIQAVKYKQQLIERQTIVNTIGKNKIEVITIRQNNPKIKTKPLILVMARQHPGQTPGSFVCEGFIDFLLSKDKEGQYLRRNYEIKIIPMVNPDGVAAGNYRTNLFGYDLNRRWDGGNRSKNLHEATYIKKYFNQIGKKREVAFVLDLHGHSRKLFSFFYGNPSSSNPIQSRVYPLLCSKLGPNLIRFEDSTFMIEEFKRNTARVQLSLSFKTQNIYTYEVSFFGYLAKNKEKKHFTMQSMKQLGQILGRSLYLHERGKQLIQNNPDNKEIYLYKRCINELRSNNTLISLGEQQNSGSESSPEECEVKEKEEQRLESNDDYVCNKSPPKVKIVRKIIKKDFSVKETSKTSRQMQVLDIAQVYSAFPSNIIALIPNSYLNKIKKPAYIHMAAQTDDFPLIKIYQSCKQQELTFNSAGHTSVLHTQEEETPFSEKRTTSNLLRSNILTRPTTSNQDYEHSDYVPLSLKSQRKSREIKRKEQTTSAKKAPLVSGKVKTQDKASQTTITLQKWYSNHVTTSYSLASHSSFSHHSHSVCNPSNVSNQSNTSNLSTINNLRVKLSQEADLLEYKSIDPSYSTLQYKASKSINKAISKGIIQNLKSRRKN